MPRIRTIKPEFCTSEQIVECSPIARLLFVTMWCFCDDAGRHPASVRRLKMECFPADDFSSRDIELMVDELKNAGLLVQYEYDGQAFWQVTGWKHQKIDRPNYKFGPLDGSGKPMAVIQKSSSARRVLDEQSPPEGKGREGKGKEHNNAANKLPHEREEKPYSEAFHEFWNAYPLNAKGRKRGKQATYSLWRKVASHERSDLLQAVKNYARESGEFVRDPERFLQKDFWRDYIDAPEKNRRESRVATADDLANWSPNMAEYQK